MSNGLGGNITVHQKRRTPGAPFSSNAADNGLSVDAVTGKIVLGDDAGGVLATLLSPREIQLNGNAISFIGTANFSQIDISEFIFAARMGQGLPDQGLFQLSDTLLIISQNTTFPQAAMQKQMTSLLWEVVATSILLNAGIIRLNTNAGGSLFLEYVDQVGGASSLNLTGGNMELINNAISINGNPGFTGTVVGPASITVENGIVTNVT
jgi:hypothetical protein